MPWQAARSCRGRTGFAASDGPTFSRYWSRLTRTFAAPAVGSGSAVTGDAVTGGCRAVAGRERRQDRRGGSGAQQAAAGNQVIHLGDQLIHRECAGSWPVQVSGTPVDTRRSMEPGRPRVTASWDGDR